MSTGPSLRERLSAFEGRDASPPEEALDPVTQTAIRQWVEAMGDTNPVYVDDAAARATGRQGVVAPPTMLQAWTMRGLAASQRPDPRPSGRGELFAVLDEAGFTSVVATNCEQTYERELRPGDRIAMREVIESVSDEKDTALGRGHFITTRMTFTDGDGDVVGTQLWRLLRFAPRPRPETEAESTSAARPPRPRPAINRDNAFFFEGAAAGKLLIQRCSSCGSLRHPPGPMCPQCGSTEWDTVEASGRGTVHSFVVNHYPQIPSFDYPLAVGLVELEEGTRVVSNIVDVAPEDITIGMAVQVRFEELGDGLVLPQFAPELDPAKDGA
jgi:uncharacterized protein